MPRKQEIRENYYQLTGRPHSGLADPAKFGLTLEQVVSLIEEGKWKDFYTNWYRKEKRKKERQERIDSRINNGKTHTNQATKRRRRRKARKYRCTCCKQRFPMSFAHVEINECVRICQTCVKKIQQIK